MNGDRPRRAGARAQRPADPTGLSRVLLLLGILAAAPVAAQAQRCAEDVVADVGLDGRILALRSGARFQVVPADAPLASLWFPGLEVVVCERDLNLDGTRLTSYEIRARDEPDRVRAFGLPAR